MPRTMPSLGLSPKTMPSTCAQVIRSRPGRRTCRPESRPSAMYACTCATRSAGAGCVDSQFGTPRRLPLASSSRDSVLNMPATPAGSHPGLRRVVHAELVGLHLVVASVLQEEHAERGFGRALQRLRLGNEDAEQRETDAGAGRLRVLLRRVARRDVTDLVAEHAGQLRLVVEERQDAARQVDVAAGKRERVDRRLVHDREVPRQLRTLRRAREPHADALDVPLQLGIVVDAHLPPDLGVHLLTELRSPAPRSSARTLCCRSPDWSRRPRWPRSAAAAASAGAVEAHEFSLTPSAPCRVAGLDRAVNSAAVGWASAWVTALRRT